ncbi:uncharacterized protein LOC118232967 [Anguilla anguilla]|uniref:uncharacterized protein LOC118232967 n=1 Tax=Anguilla anguilla TaxID=7936 RepID=UPI0015AEE999|nr:uncharacterized protein LOC118232967 [Anguilla anguilla]
MAQVPSSCPMTKKETTSKWSDVIKNSVQTATDPKQIYLLKTVQELLNEDGTVRRHTFGRKSPQERNRTILMVGETGTGKSSLINLMVNYMLGVKWEDNIRFEITHENRKKDQYESKTTAITAYEIYGQGEQSIPFSLTVIDTPGFEDTGGLKNDPRVSQNLYTLLNSVYGIQQIDAACLVVKASQNRLSPSQKYIFDAILSLFGKNMEKNLMILITFSDWLPASEALEAVTEFGIPFPNNVIIHYLFNNCPLTDYQKEYEKLFRTHWNNGIDSMRAFFQTLDQMETQSLKMTENVLRERNSLKACIESCESQIKEVGLKHEALDEANETLKKHEVRATFCLKCKEICHIPCTKASNPWWCKVMKWNGSCETCKCSYEIHETSSPVKFYEEKKRRCEQELRNAEAEETSLFERCFRCILQLRELALKFDSDSTRQSILRLIEVLKSNNQTEKAEKVQNILEK